MEGRRAGALDLNLRHEFPVRGLIISAPCRARGNSSEQQDDQLLSMMGSRSRGMETDIKEKPEDYPGEAPPRTGSNRRHHGRCRVPRTLALLIGLWPRWTALALIGFTGVSLWMTYGQSGLNMLLRPQQSVELFERLAIIGGLLFYFSSGPGGWSRTSLR